jgi:7-cyano-7-deazaguanine synthase
MKLDPNRAMVVLSGGQDSTTCLGWALSRYDHVSCVSFDYGQRHDSELDSAASVIDFFSVKHHRFIHHEIVSLGRGIFAGSSPLTNHREVLELYSDHTEMAAIIGDRVEKTFVPMRNAVFLAIASNRAVVDGSGVLITGVCQEDNANYPDCRRVFIESLGRAVNLALGLDDDAGLVLMTPLMDLTKAQSIELALQLPYTYEALAYTTTAYDGLYPPTGKDHASILRAHGFEEAGWPDPLVLRAWREDLMPLPNTENYRNANFAKAIGGVT